MAKNKQSIKIDADAQGFIQEIEKSAKSITSLNRELKLNQQQLKGSENNTELLTTRVQELKERYEQQTKIVENTNKAYQKSVELFGENSEETEKWKNKLVEAKEKQEKYKNALNETNKQLILQSEACIKVGEKIEKLGNKLTTAGEKIEKVGNKLSVVSAGIVAVTGTSLKASIDFESAFAGVEKTVDATTEQLEELKQGILDMSTELPSSAVEISAVAESAGQLGIQTENVLSFTKTMIDLGNSTNLTAEEASTSLAKFVNIVNMSADDYEKLGSTIVDLGNNFATTEADIVEMATRLAATGELTGLTEAQIMALATAMSSVGIEAEAGGSAMSKLLKNIQVAVETGSNDLDDFAKVAGMTSEEFKKAFKEDAVSALSSFIAGLNDTERNGRSAIAILDDMGLTEVRLSNTVLSLANSSGVMTKAIKTANNAWNSNTALTNEATKRYATTESQIKMLKNEVVKLGIEFGNELAPSLRTLLKDMKPVLTTISDTIKQFSKLDTTTKQNIIRAGALVVALGPVVKTAGSVTTAIGNTTTAIGKVTNAIGVMKTGTQSSSASVNALASTLKGLTSPVGLVTIGITGLTAAYAAFIYKQYESSRNAEKIRENTEKEIKSQKELMQTYDESKNATIAQMDSVDKLSKELEQLVDENGKVKQGYEDRVDFILNQLNSALGTEFNRTGELIDKYSELKKEINDLVRTKKAQAILEAEEGKYNEALTKKADTYSKMLDYQKQLKEAQEKLTKAEEEYQEVGHTGMYFYDSWMLSKVDNAKKTVEELQKSYDSEKNMYNDYLKVIRQYENDQIIMESGTTEQVNEMIMRRTTSYNNATDDIASSIQQQIANQLYDLQQTKTYLQESIDANDEAAKKECEIQKNSQELQLKNLVDSLAKMTSITEEMTPAQIDAWKQLATGSYDIYKEKLSEMPSEMQQKIQEITGVITNDTTVVEAYKNLCNKVCAEGEKIDLSNVGEKWIESLNKGLKDNIGLLKGTMTAVATVLSVKTNNINVSSTAGHADGLAYVPYNNYVARLHEGERVLTKKENAEYIRNNISNKNSRNAIVNIYSQNVTDGVIRQIIRAIESDWGDRI